MVGGTMNDSKLKKPYRSVVRPATPEAEPIPLVVDRACWFSVQRKDAGFGLHVLEAVDVDLAADDVPGVDHVLAFGHNRFPRVGHMPGSAAGCFHWARCSRFPQTRRPWHRWWKSAIQSPDQHFKGRPGLGQVAETISTRFAGTPRWIWITR